jgi:hypothetical protein
LNELWETFGKCLNKSKLIKRFVSQNLWGNRERFIDRDAIKQWKLDGWTFRVKPVKSKNITTEKENRRKFLGRFSQSLWSLIENTSVKPSTLERRYEIENVIEQIVSFIHSNKVHFPSFGAFIPLHIKEREFPYGDKMYNPRFHLLFWKMFKILVKT